MKKILPLLLLAAIVSGCSSQPKTFEEYVQAGKKAFSKKEFDKARNYLGQAVAMRPSDRESLYFLGMAYSRDFLYDSAFFYLKKVDLLYPDDREVNQQLYNLALDLEDWDAAKHALGVLISTGDPAEEYYAELAQLNLRTENYATAHRYYQLLMEKEPDNPNWWLQNANTAAQLDSLNVGIALIDSAIQVFGDRDELLLNKGLFLAAQKKYGQAEDLFRTLYGRDSSSVPYRLNLAHVLASQDNKAKHEEAYRLYQQLKGSVTADFAIDSLMNVLEQQLGITPSDSTVSDSTVQD